MKREFVSRAATKHGHCRPGSKTPEYSAWRDMIDRCERHGNRKYPDYGGRGIGVCEAWRGDFLAFLSDVGPRPSPKHSLDRVNNNVGYQPGNCRWALCREQNTNKRNSVLVMIDGEMVPIVIAAESLGVNTRTAWGRFVAAGRPTGDAKAIILGECHRSCDG
jgi:hypothetical protein